MHRLKSKLISGLSIITFLFIEPNTSYGQQPLAKKTYNIVDYGAIAGGRVLNTKAIQSAIDAANSGGGGKVIFPKGKFLTGSIEMKSGVNILSRRRRCSFGKHRSQRL